MLLNLAGRQITGKVQSLLVVITLIGDIVLAIGVWTLIANRQSWDANWASPTPVDWLTFFTVAGLWLGIMAGIMEVQQVLVDEWRNFGQSRDVGLLSAAWQLWIRQIPLALGVLASLPLAALVVLPVPTVGVVEHKFGHNALFYLAMFTMIIATYTTLSVYFMGMGRIIALYSQQGALPRVLGRYSSRSVPWVAILLLAAFALIGAYWSNFTFIATVLSTWSVTLYFIVALFYLRMRRRRDLERPLQVRFGTPIAAGLLIFTGLIGYAIYQTNHKAFLVWCAIRAALVLYDWFVVRGRRGGSSTEPRSCADAPAPRGSNGITTDRHDRPKRGRVLMGRKRHAEIAGAGLGGLASGIALAQRGWTVRIHERSSAPGCSAPVSGCGKTGRSLAALGVEREATSGLGQSRRSWPRTSAARFSCVAISTSGPVGPAPQSRPVRRADRRRREPWCGDRDEFPGCRSDTARRVGG